MKLIHFFTASILLIINLACNKNPVKPDNSDYTGPSRIIVYLKDENGKPIPDDYLNVDLKVQQGDNIKYIHYFPKTDKSGKAVVDSIPAGTYKIDYYYSKKGTVDSLNCQFSYIERVILEDNHILEVKINIPSKIDLKLKVCYFDDKNILKENPKGIADITVKLSPGNYSAITDKDGYVSYTGIPLNRYTINMTHYGASLTKNIGNFTYSDREYLEEKIIFMNNKPQINILSPGNGSYHNYNGILFKCEGDDFEDGALPDSSLVWNSDISGKIGTGREVLLNYITAGHHNITLRGTDTSGEITEKTIDIYVTFDDKSSFYPYPLNSYWNYSYDSREITVSYPDNNTEIWSLTGINVSTDEVDSRNCKMEYEIIRGNEALHCSYYIIDYYRTNGINIYVSKTVEQLQIYGLASTGLVESIDIETEYSPEMLLINNHTNLNPGDSYNSSVSATVKSVYFNKQLGTTNDIETKTILTSYSVGDLERIETQAGVFETLPLTIDINGVQKKWNLAKGVGIVKIGYNISDIPVSASLTNTNIFSYYGVSKPLLTSKNPESLKISAKKNPGTSGRMLEIADLLRKMCPR